MQGTGAGAGVAFRTSAGVAEAGRWTIAPASRGRAAEGRSGRHKRSVRALSEAGWTARRWLAQFALLVLTAVFTLGIGTTAAHALSASCQAINADWGSGRTVTTPSGVEPGNSYLDGWYESLEDGEVLTWSAVASAVDENSAPVEGSTTHAYYDFTTTALVWD